MMNRPLDLIGLLTILWQDAWGDSGPVEAPGSLDPLHTYRAAEREWEELQPPVYLLSPRMLLHVAGRRKQITAYAGLYALRVLLRLFGLSRRTGDRIDSGWDQPDIIVGADIPPMQIDTVDLAFPPEALREHDRHYSPLVEALFGPGPDASDAAPEPKARTYNLAIQRQLAFLGFSPRLYRFICSVRHEEGPPGSSP